MKSPLLKYSFKVKKLEAEASAEVDRIFIKPTINPKEIEALKEALMEALVPHFREAAKIGKQFGKFIRGRLGNAG